MGFHAKSAAVLAASFDEVLLLDSDSMLFQAPEEFFKQPEFLRSGLLLFRDYQQCRKFSDPLYILLCVGVCHICVWNCAPHIRPGDSW